MYIQSLIQHRWWWASNGCRVEVWTDEHWAGEARTSGKRS